jgi:hypothetical protein
MNISHPLSDQSQYSLKIHSDDSYFSQRSMNTMQEEAADCFLVVVRSRSLRYNYRDDTQMIAARKF